MPLMFLSPVSWSRLLWSTMPAKQVQVLVEAWYTHSRSVCSLQHCGDSLLYLEAECPRGYYLLIYSARRGRGVCGENVRISRLHHHHQGNAM